jgi:hypothetical protein
VRTGANRTAEALVRFVERRAYLAQGKQRSTERHFG